MPGQPQPPVKPDPAWSGCKPVQKNVAKKRSALRFYIKRNMLFSLSENGKKT
jgi:hypothetical protein